MFRRKFRFTAALFLLAVVGGQSCAHANGVNTSIEFGKTVSGTLSGTGVDTYTFKTKKGGSIVITASETGQHDDNFSMQLDIRGPGDAGAGGGKPVLYRQVMNDVAEGDWTVKISDFGTVAGAYNFTVLRIPGVTGTKVKFGQEYKGTIKGGALDVYRISGTPGVSVDINVTPSNNQFITAFLFFDPSGVNTGGGGCAGQCSNGMQFTAYGDYIMVVGADEGGGGPAESAYTLSVTRAGEAAAPAEQAQPSVQTSAQPPPPPSPPAPQAMSVAQVFENPVSPIYINKVLPVSDYPLIYENGMILTFNADYYGLDLERRKADHGTPLAQLHTGDNYFKTSPKQAVDDFWAKAADQGNNDARNRLGVVYARFHPEQAQKYRPADWYAQAIAQGALDAPVKIANLYHGTDHPQDDATIVKLATGYADKGIPEAQYVLGVAYETGQGVNQDYATAENWYHKAAEKGNRNAEYALGKLYENGHGVPLSPQGSNPVPPDPYFEGVKWYRLASDHGLPAAQFRRATLYLSGYGESTDFTKARALFQSAAEQGLAAAQFNLAVMYAHGIGGETDYASAGQWYAKAAAQGLILAENDLGELYEHGAGVVQDYAAAFKWYRMSADAGYPVAQYNLGRLYKNGQGVGKDPAQAKTLFTKAAAEGHVGAQVELDEVDAAAGKPQAHDDAIKLLRTTADQGDNAALGRLIELYRTDGVKATDYDDILDSYREAAKRMNPVAFIALADLFAKKDPPDYPESYYWYQLASASAKEWHVFPDERDVLKKYADAEAGKIAGELLPEQIAVVQWRIADRSKPAPDKRQLAGADLYIKGDLAEKQGNYITAMQYYMDADSDNVGIAAEDLGLFFEGGMGVNRDMNRAMYYYKKAVRNGRIGPATWIGDIYLYGIGIPADMKEAEKWYQMDADRGYGRAVDSLGWIYLFGEKDAQAKAFAAYEKYSALYQPAGHLATSEAIGMIYLYGIGGAKNVQKALRWYAGDLMLKSNMVDRQPMSSAYAIQAASILINFEPRDEGHALGLLLRAHDNDPILYNDLGYMYERGLGVAEASLDFSKRPRPFQSQQPAPKLPTAIELYKKAADMCYGRAMYHIGRLYQSGVNDPAISAQPIPKDPDTALKWMKMAAYYGSGAAADWLKGKDKNDPNPKAVIEPEMSLSVKACQTLEGSP